jgi:hypothetical protein
LQLADNCEFAQFCLGVYSIHFSTGGTCFFAQIIVSHLVSNAPNAAIIIFERSENAQHLL